MSGRVRDWLHVLGKVDRDGTLSGPLSAAYALILHLFELPQPVTPSTTYRRISTTASYQLGSSLLSPDYRTCIPGPGALLYGPQNGATNLD